MRATLNFEIDAHRVKSVMRCLVAEEGAQVREVADALVNAESPNLMAEIEGALASLHSVTAQLHQYRTMLATFEHARFETLLPQPVDASHSKFDDFLGRMVQPEESDDNPEEG